MTQPATQGLPTIGSVAPDFEQQSTVGPVRLSQYTGAGKWVVLFSHPSDFTPVCSTEMVGFARRAADFDALNVQLLGLSIDSVFSHIAWVRNMEEKWGAAIPFPILADLDMKVARLYGMLHPGASETATVRAVFVIDPKQFVRALVYYPMSCGRSIDEILRLVRALQTADKHGVACPAEWTPGQKVIIPPPKTKADAEARMKQEGIDRKDWYFSEKAV